MRKYSFDAVIFDLDGVITKTALVHARSWKATFDDYLRLRAERNHEEFREFTHQGDYLPYVDGKPRYKGVESFLASRGITLDFGSPADAPDKETVCGLGNKKNENFRRILEKEGVEVYTATVDIIKQLKRAGIKVGVASSSKNCEAVLGAAGLDELFEVRVDGVVSSRLALKGKPEPDIFIRAAFDLGVQPALSVVVEDASSGVLAARCGGFGLVLGLARENNEKNLFCSGADIVVEDFARIGIDAIEDWFRRRPRPLFDFWRKEAYPDNPYFNPALFRSGVSVFLGERKPVFFLDYDGTLTPIVGRPEWAVISGEMRDAVAALCDRFTVAIVSGRMRQDVQNLLGIEGLFYAGSHGFDIAGPGFSLVEPRASRLIPVIEQTIAQLKHAFQNIEGLIIEEKKFSVAVHYRLVDENKYFERIKSFIEKTIRVNNGLRVLHGKKVFEIMPNIDWNKGKAVDWIMRALNLDWHKHSIVYIGDDTTDEDAFRFLRTRGTGILVSRESRPSAADFVISSPRDVKEMFKNILSQV